MGKSFQNFMCKKDFHPSASWNLKKVWEAREIESQKKTREEELRVQYEKEQEVLNNKALLGDEKAKLGLSFLYDAPAGMSKKEETKEEPKFEWQRKYQAPREEWAKDNKLIQDQPFGIEVRNVRCSKCHQWGHVNTDSLCPLYQMSGNHQDAGYRNNPSALFKEYHKKKTENGPSVTTDRPDDQWVDNEKLHEEMSKEHGFALKNSLMRSISIDQKLKGRKAHKTEKICEAGQMKEFLSNMDEKEKRKLMKKLMKSEKRGKKDKKSRKRRT